MARKNNVIGIELGVDVTSLKAGLAEANKRIRDSAKEFNVSASTMEDWRKSAEGIRAKVKQLTNEYSLQELKLRAIQDEYDATVKSQGENSKMAQKLKNDLQAQQITVNKLKISLGNYEDTLEKAEKGEIDLEKATLKNGKAFQKLDKQVDEVKESTNKLGEGFTVLKGTLANLISSGINAFVSGIKSSIAETKELRKEFGMLEATAKATGSSFETAEKNLIKVASITDDTGAAVEGMNNLMAAGFDGANMDKLTDQLLGASIKFKDTLKFEGLSDGLQETLAQGKAIGPFSELLERSGVSLETFDAGLSKATSEADKQKYVLEQLSKLGLTEAKDAYEEINGSLIDNNKANLENQNAWAKVGKSLEPLATQFTNFKTKALEALIPSIQRISEELIKVFQGDFSGVATFFTNIKTKIQEQIPLLIEKLKEVFPQIIQFLVDNIPTIIDSIVSRFTEFYPKLLEVAVFLFNSLVDAIPGLIETLLQHLPTVIDNISKFISDSLPKVFDAAKKMFRGIVDAIPKIVKLLVENLPNILNSLLNFFKENYPKILEEGYTLIGELIAGILKIIPEIPTLLFGLIEGIWDFIMETDWMDLGLDIVKGILSGFSNAGDIIWKAVKDFGNTCVNKIKDFFKIDSPSKLMEDEVGLDLGNGVGSGLVKSVKNVNKDIGTFNKAILGNMDIGSQIAGATNNMSNVNFTQIINSTKEPTIRELARYTNNLLDLNKIKGGLV